MEQGLDLNQGSPELQKKREQFVDQVLKRPHHYAQKAGYVWNPLRSWPRNSPCWCGNGKKAKVCHLRTTPDLVKTEEAADLKARLAIALAAA